jgi:dTDP-4-dehydrorhamnose reductase
MATPDIQILVTGADGQLASCIKQAAANFPNFDFVFASRADLDITNASDVDTLFQKNSFHYCINTAAYTAVDLAETEPKKAFLINDTAVGILANACEQHRTKLIHISTDYVFDGMNEEGYTETHPTNPVSVYGASKLAGEQRALRQSPGCMIIRTSWVFSAHGKNFVRTMLRLMKEREEIRVVNDQFGSPTHAMDLAVAMLTVIHQDQFQPGIFHFANSGVTTWFHLAEAIGKHAGYSGKLLPITTSEYPTPAKRPAYSVLLTEKFAALLSSAPQSWQSSLALLFETGEI